MRILQLYLSRFFIGKINKNSDTDCNNAPFHLTLINSATTLTNQPLECDKGEAAELTDYCAKAAGIKTNSSVNSVSATVKQHEWQKSKEFVGVSKRRGSGSSRRKRYETDRV